MAVPGKCIKNPLVPGKIPSLGHHKFEILRTVPTKSKIFLRSLLNTREEVILTSVTEIQKENWG